MYETNGKNEKMAERPKLGDIRALTFLHGWVLEVWMERILKFKELL
ncbi:hypothetical protein Nmel_003966 [Mimus melanotis]